MSCNTMSEPTEENRKIMVVPPDARGPNGKFKPGKSGNPNGRPKGTKGLTTLLREALKQQAYYLSGPNKGQPIIIGEEHVRWEQALIARVVDKAVSRGDYKTLNMIFDRLEGKPLATINFNEITEEQKKKEDALKQTMKILTHGAVTVSEDDQETEDI